jgi:hypothetical protein
LRRKFFFILCLTFLSVRIFFPAAGNLTAAETSKPLYTSYNHDKNLNKTRWKEVTRDLNYPKAEPLRQTKKKSTATKKISAGWLMYIVYAALIALLIFIITRLLRIKGNRKVENTPVKFSEELAAEELIPDAPYEKYLAEAIADGNYRIAVRFSYLITLRDLSGRRLITIAKDKTNYEYLLELIKNPVLGLFREVTYVFEKTWYGEMEITDGEFQSFENKFADLRQQINNTQ